MTTPSPEEARAGAARAARSATPAPGDPPQRTPGRAGAGGTGALAVWIALVALAALSATLALSPGMAGWGFNLLRFVAPARGWTLWAAGTLLLIPALARPVAAGLAALRERASHSAGLRAALAAAWVLGAALLVWSLPDRVAFTGDFLIRQGAALESLPPAVLFPQALPLDNLLHYHLPRLLIQSGVKGPDRAARLIDAVEAAALAALALGFAAVVAPGGAAAPGLAALVLFGGWLSLLTGYGKAFSELTVLAVAIAVLGMRLRSSGAGLAGLGLTLAVALALHRSALAFLPAGSLALAGGLRARGRGAWRSPATWIGVLAPLATLIVLLPRLTHTIGGFDVAHHIAPAGVAGFGGVMGAAFAPGHLLDLVNLVGQLAPVALTLPIALLVAGPRLLGGREGALLLALAAPQLLMLLFVHPTQGVFRDWDVFAPAGVSLAMLAALAVSRMAADARWRWLPVPAAAAAVVAATLGLLQWADLERGITRVAAFATEPPPRSDSERGETWEFLGTCANQLGRPEQAAEAMSHAAALIPSTRVLMEWGLSEATRGNYHVARGAFEQAIARDSTQSRLWLNLLAVCVRLDDQAGIHRAAEALRRLNPDDPRIHQMLEAIERRGAETR